MRRPRVFKVADSWVWICDHSAICSETFRPSEHRDPWCAAVSAAVAHHARWHAEARNAVYR